MIQFSLIECSSKFISATQQAEWKLHFGAIAHLQQAQGESGEKKNVRNVQENQSQGWQLSASNSCNYNKTMKVVFINIDFMKYCETANLVHV